MKSYSADTRGTLRLGIGIDGNEIFQQVVVWRGEDDSKQDRNKYTSEQGSMGRCHPRAHYPPSCV